MPHSPQLAMSDDVSMHPPVQHSVPPAHAAPVAPHTHSLFTQFSLAPHCTPHAPQFCGSLSTSEQPPGQHCSPATHAAEKLQLQVPLEQAFESGSVQVLPQLPQF
jgi:hypothetical protein